MGTLFFGAEPSRKPMEKARAMLCKAFETAKGDGGRLETGWGTIQITMCAKSGEQKRSEVEICPARVRSRKRSMDDAPRCFKPDVCRC